MASAAAASAASAPPPSRVQEARSVMASHILAGRNALLRSFTTPGD